MMHEIVILEPANDAALISYGDDKLIISSNGRGYVVSELKRVAKYFNGLQCFYIHAKHRSKRAFRVTNEKILVGTIEGAYWDNDKHSVNATLHCTSSWWDPILQIAHKRRGYGFSLDCDAKGQRVKTKILNMEIIETITKLYSVDMVPNPAAGGRFADGTQRPADEFWHEFYINSVVLENI